MSMLLKRLMTRYQAPAEDDGADTGGTGVAEEEIAVLEDRGDVVNPEVNADNLQALVAGAGGEGGGQGPNDEQVAGTEDDDAGGHGARATGIPKSRFNEVNEQRKAAEAKAAELEAELARLRAGQSAAASSTAAPAAQQTAAEKPAFDEEAMEQSYVEALIEGDSKKAASIRREINTHLREQTAAAVRAQAEQDRQAEQARAAANDLAAESAATIQAYPYLDTEEGAEALELIVAARDSKIARGMAPAAALRAAVKAIAPKFAPAGAGAAADTPTKDLPPAQAKGDLRTAAAIKRGAEASVAQPAQLTGGVGERAEAGRVNVEQMTDDQFAKLTDADKRKLRGD